MGSSAPPSCAGFQIKQQIHFKLAVQITITARGDPVSMALILRSVPQPHQAPLPEIADRLAPAYPWKTGEDITVTVDAERVVTCPAPDRGREPGERGTEKSQMGR